MVDTVISIDNVSKRFKLYHNMITGPIQEFLFFWKRKQYYQEFLAMHDVSLEVKRGEIVGIIGANGAGKTTLLKMIAGLLPVDRGCIKVSGKITALLARGAGVHPEFTGRENILYSAMLLGMSKRAVQRKMEEIVEFSELADYIDRPFRTYSSGMRARLLFSASIFIEPDILIIDEALATGDAQFVAKSARKIREMVKSGATILFVSHNMQQIEDLCQRGIVLEQGRLAFDGIAIDAVQYYVKSAYKNLTERLSLETAHQIVQPMTSGTGEVYICEMFFVANEIRTNAVAIGDSCELHIVYEALNDLEKVRVFVQVHSSKFGMIYAILPSNIPGLLNTGYTHESFSITKGKGKIIFRFDRLLLGEADYSCNVGFYPDREGYQFSYDTCYSYYINLMRFQAIYRNAYLFGRDVVTEIPSVSFEVTSEE